jgi:Tfp pilus assembly protein PilF
MIIFTLIFCFYYPAISGTFKGLEPGTSTKSDADKILGQPYKEVIRNIRYDYAPENSDTQRISITFDSKSRVIESINIHPKQSYSKVQYREWLELKSPEKTEIDATGNLVEYYIKNGIALHFKGPDDTSAVRFFSHFDPASVGRMETPRAKGIQKNEKYYIDESDNALENKNWSHAKNLILEGLDKYPNSAELWHNRAAYYLRSKNEPRQKRISETTNSMFRAYELNPSGQYAAEMGWFHRELRNDCTLALSYFEEAEKKGYAKERPDLLYWMGTCYEKIGMFSSAKTYYSRFLDVAPSHEKRLEAETAIGRLK